MESYKFGIVFTSVLASTFLKFLTYPYVIEVYNLSTFNFSSLGTIYLGCFV